MIETLKYQHEYIEKTKQKTTTTQFEDNITTESMKPKQAK